MTNDVNEKVIRREILRVTLDAKAAEAFDQMVQRLKEFNSWVRFFPSEFISFLVSDFYETYFEDDKELYAANFFDSRGFVNSETKKAKSEVNFEEVLRETLAKAEKIKSKVRRKSKIKPMRNHSQLNAEMPHEDL